MPPLICFLIASICLGIGINMLRRSLYLRYKGSFAIGTITSIQFVLPRRKDLMITFKTTKNRKVIFKETVGGFFGDGLLEAGDPVAVLYHPDKPYIARIYTRDALWTMPLGLIGFGLFFLFGMIYGLMVGL